MGKKKKKKKYGYGEIGGTKKNGMSRKREGLLGATGGMRPMMPF